MNPKLEAKKEILKSLIKDMQRRMVELPADADQPVDIAEALVEAKEEMPAAEEEEAYADAPCEACGKSPCECEEEGEAPKRPAMTITLAAIKKAPRPAPKPTVAVTEVVSMKAPKAKKKG